MHIGGGGTTYANSTVAPGVGIAVLMSMTPPLVIVGLSFREGNELGISNSTPAFGCSNPGEPEAQSSETYQQGYQQGGE